jgi:hypothetical protein
MLDIRPSIRRFSSFSLSDSAFASPIARFSSVSTFTLLRRIWTSFSSSRILSLSAGASSGFPPAVGVPDAALSFFFGPRFPVGITSPVSLSSFPISFRRERDCFLDGS